MTFTQRLKKIYYFFFNPLRKVYFFIFRPETQGVKIIIENNGKLLMSRISYAHKGWVFPGGKVEKGETFEEGALREMNEEVGLKTEKLIEIGEYVSNRGYNKDTVKCFYLYTDSDYFKIDNFEVIEAGWYKPEEIPQNCSFSVPEIIKIYKEYKLK